MQRVASIHFSSHLPLTQREALERLFFFNARQGDYLDAIKETVVQFGSPSIQEGLHGLCVHLSLMPQAQCLFAVTHPEKQLVGVALFTRNDDHELEILHLATAPEWQDPANPLPGVGALILEIHKIAKRIQHIRGVRLPYGRGRLPVFHS